MGVRRWVGEYVGRIHHQAYRVRNFPDHLLVSQDKEEEEEDPRKVHGLQGTTASITGESSTT